jgi:predicted RNase H-like nuclease (RuvC/YqgF family)
VNEKIASLVRLAMNAGSPNEANTAAMQVCRLLMSSGSVPKDSQQQATEPRETNGRSSSAPNQEEIASLQRRNRALTAQVESLTKQLQELKNPPVGIISKFESRCKSCAEPIEVGERCWWRKGIPGVTCIACGHS